MTQTPPKPEQSDEEAAKDYAYELWPKDFMMSARRSQAMNAHLAGAQRVRALMAKETHALDWAIMRLKNICESGRSSDSFYAEVTLREIEEIRGKSE